MTSGKHHPYGHSDASWLSVIDRSFGVHFGKANMEAEACALMGHEDLQTWQWQREGSAGWTDGQAPIHAVQDWRVPHILKLWKIWENWGDLKVNRLRWADEYTHRVVWPWPWVKRKLCLCSCGSRQNHFWLSDIWKGEHLEDGNIWKGELLEDGKTKKPGLFLSRMESCHFLCPEAAFGVCLS